MNVVQIAYLATCISCNTHETEKTGFFEKLFRKPVFCKRLFRNPFSV